MTISKEIANETQKIYADTRKGILLNSLLFVLILSYEGWALSTQEAAQRTLSVWVRLPVFLFILPCLGYYGIYRGWKYSRLLQRFVRECDLSEPSIAELLISQQRVVIEELKPDTIQVAIFQHSYRCNVLTSSTQCYYLPISAEA